MRAFEVAVLVVLLTSTVSCVRTQTADITCVTSRLQAPQALRLLVQGSSMIRVEWEASGSEACLDYYQGNFSSIARFPADSQGQLRRMSIASQSRAQPTYLQRRSTIQQALKILTSV